MTKQGRERHLLAEPALRLVGGLPTLELKPRALRSGVEPLTRFARRPAERRDGSLAHCRFQPHTSLLDVNVNQIKIIWRKALGFRDNDYLVLKMRAGFPG